MLSGMQSALKPYQLQAAGDSPTDDGFRVRVAPLVDALNDFVGIRTVHSGGDLREQFIGLRAATNAVQTALSADDARPQQTVDQVISNFATEYRMSLILALTANHALSQLLMRWQDSQRDSATPTANHLDLRTMQPVPEESHATVPLSVLASAMTGEPTVITPATFASIMNSRDGGSPPPIFQMAYTQWFATIIAAWEDTYRPRLAAAHGTDEQGNSWTKNDIRSQFFYELNQIRHDVSHHAGICVESAGNNVIDWLPLEAGTTIAPTSAQMLQFLDHFPDEELRQTPTRITPTTERLPFQFDRSWVATVAAVVARVEIVKAKRPQVIRRVIDAWMATVDPVE